MENWAKKTRFEKIREIKERELENSYKKNINPTIKESKLSHKLPKIDESPSHTYVHQASQQPEDAKQDDLAQQVEQEHPHLPQVQSSQQDDNKPAIQSQPVEQDPHHPEGVHAHPLAIGDAHPICSLLRILAKM